jgi:hypothetical protein
LLWVFHISALPMTNKLSMARDIATLIRLGVRRKPGTLLFIGTRQAQDDDSVFLALVAIDSVDFHQCLEPVAPNTLVELLANQPLLFGIHADDTDQRIILVLEVWKGRSGIARSQKSA